MSAVALLLFPVPTPEALTCVGFQYGIQNSAGFDADDIFNEVNNTLKTGLIIATANVTIQVLNASYPRQDVEDNTSRRNLKSQQGQVHRHLLRATKQMERYNGNGIVTNFIATSPEAISAPVQEQHQQRSLAYLPQSPSATTSEDSWGTISRRLVYYTYEFQPVINNIVDNPFCDAPEGFLCAVVDTTVCVILEEGDDEDEVRNTLLAGISTAIEDGTFSAAIPPEHQLPGGDMIEPESN
jgi:hypothetical protein